MLGRGYVGLNRRNAAVGGLIGRLCWGELPLFGSWPAHPPPAEGALDDIKVFLSGGFRGS